MNTSAERIRVDSSGREETPPTGLQSLCRSRIPWDQVAGVESRSFDSPDEMRTPDKTKVDVVRMGGTTAARFTMEPGWKTPAGRAFAPRWMASVVIIGIVQLMRRL
jgi:hypothetical protein